jgi:hypothetical protein
MGKSTHKNAEVMPSADESANLFFDQSGYATTVAENLQQFDLPLQMLSTMKAKQRFGVLQSTLNAA